MADKKKEKKKRESWCVCVRGNEKGFRDGRRCVLGRCAKRGF